MATTAGHRLTLVPMGKCSNAFFSETTNMIKAKLYMNVHRMVLYNLKVFCSDMKSKMAATAELSLTLELLGKRFQNASSLKPLGQLKPNCPGMIIGRSPYKVSVFYVDRKSKMATTAGHRLTLDPMGKCSNAFFSGTTNMIKAKLYMNVHRMVLYSLKVFCSDMKFKMAATAELSGGYGRTYFNIGPYGKKVSKCFFYETTWTIETKLPRNDHWKVLYKVSVFYADRKSNMAATTGHSINTGPYGENTEICSLKLLH